MRKLIKLTILGAAVVGLQWVALAPGTPAYAEAPDVDPSWDVMTPRGVTREIDFDTEEGTWMSLDVSPDGRWIAFDLLGSIYRVSISGGEAACLTCDSGIALNGHPQFSPDSKTIVFISDRKGQANLWLMDADGRDPRPVYIDNSSRAVEPTFTPDGQHIVYTKQLMLNFGFGNVNNEIWQVALDGSQDQKLAGHPDSGATAPVKFSPNPRSMWPSLPADGTYMYYAWAEFDGQNRQLRRMHLSSGRIDNVTESKTGYASCCGRPAHNLHLGEAAPEVSPDGKWLTFSRKIPEGKLDFRGIEYMGRTALWLRHLETGEERILMDPIESDATEDYIAWKLRPLPGYSWVADGQSVVIAQGGKIRRVWVDSGRVDTIPFKARVHRVISEQARGHVEIDDEHIAVRAVRWPLTTADGTTRVFEAIGRLWAGTASGGSPRLLTPGHADAFEVTPALSPDGRWIAYVTTDNGVGQVYKIPLAGGQPVQLTTRPGFYLHPSWAPDGKTLIVNESPAELTFVHAAAQWNVLRLSASGGTAARIRGPGVLVKTGYAADGRIYFSEPASRKFSQVLVSVDDDWGDRREHLVWAGPLPNFAVSPDGRWLATERMNDIQITPMPPFAAGEPPLLDAKAAENPLTIQRISFEGGLFPHWITAERLEFSSAKDHVIHDVVRGKARAVPFGLVVQRDRGRGTVAFTGARIVPLNGKNVIENGTVVIDGARITCVGVCDTTGVGKRFDVSGTTIIPGLLDTHAHHQSGEDEGVFDRNRVMSAVYLAYGITTTLDPSVANSAFSLNELTAAGKVVGPQGFTTGPILTCAWEAYVGLYARIGDDVQQIETFKDAENIVNRLARQGAISVKDYKQCTRAQRQMLAEASRRAGVSQTTENGDLNYIIGQLMDGYTGWEHPMQYKPIYSDVSRFIGAAGGHYSADLILSDMPHGNAMEYWFGRNDLWFDKKATDWMEWQRIAERRIFVKKPLSEYMFPILAQGAADIFRAGGYVTTGAHNEQDGLGTHWELWTMAMAVGPEQALEFSSMHGAHFLGLEDELGSIEVGKLADFVVLNSNPLDNIENSLDNRYVVRAGKVYDTGTLDELWPDQKPYGPHPWVNDDIRRLDKRPVD